MQLCSGRFAFDQSIISLILSLPMSSIKHVPFAPLGLLVLIVDRLCCRAVLNLLLWSRGFCWASLI